MLEIIAHYIRAFTSLNRNHGPRLGSAPHKPILLLSILDCIERGHFRENAVGLTPELVATFHAYWRRLVPVGTWDPRIIYPFRHLASDGFWQLVKDGQVVSSKTLRHPTGIGQLTAAVDYGQFDDALWTLLVNRMERQLLIRALMDVYFPALTQSDTVGATIEDPLAAEATRLIEQALHQKFRKEPLPAAERQSDMAFVRRALFPKVIRSLYGNSCAVCQLGVEDQIGHSLVEAAHIMQFAKFGNDDPRNGLALCRNHHGAFDFGWFSLTDAFAVIVSPGIREAGAGDLNAFLKPGVSAFVPANPHFAPAAEALAYHRFHVFQA